MGKKRKRKKIPGIAWQNKDIMSKYFGETMKNHSFSAYGVNMPRIVRVMPTNLPEVTADELRIDNLFLLEDESIAIVDYESTYLEQNKIKYAGYLQRVMKRCYREFGRFVQLRMIVIYTADVERGTTESVMNLGCTRLETEEAFLSDLDSEMIRSNLETKLTDGAPLADEDVMKFIILPLTYKGRERQKQAVSEAVDLSEKITDAGTQNFVLSGMLVFTDKIIDEEIAEKIRRKIKMTKVGRLIEEEFAERQRKKIQEVTKEVTETVSKEKSVAIARKLLADGIPEEKIADYTDMTIQEIRELEDPMEG